MVCPNCKAELIGTEAFCTKCGINLRNTVNLVISRPGKFMGCAIALDVTVNNQPFKLGAGEDLKLCISNGDCVVKYSFWCRREKEVILNIQPGKQYSIVFKYDALWGGFKIGKESILN